MIQDIHISNMYYFILGIKDKNIFKVHFVYAVNKNWGMRISKITFARLRLYTCARVKHWKDRLKISEKDNQRSVAR